MTTHSTSDIYQKKVFEQHNVACLGARSACEERLKEYRATQIAAAVTGQSNVHT